MKKLVVGLLSAVCAILTSQAQDGVMVKNLSQKTISVQVAIMRVTLEPQDSVKFTLKESGEYLLRVQYINDRKDTIVFRKIINSPGVAKVTDLNLERWRTFYCPEKNGEPVKNRKTQF